MALFRKTVNFWSGAMEKRGYILQLDSQLCFEFDIRIFTNVLWNWLTTWNIFSDLH